MSSKKQVTIETLVSWASDLLAEQARFCDKSPDSFTLLMLTECERIPEMIYFVGQDVIKTQVDAASLLMNIFKHRNEVLKIGDEEKVKIRGLWPYEAVDSVRYIFEWDEDEYVSAIAYMAYLCWKLSLRHHLRRNFHQAAMYASNAFICTNMMSCFLPVTSVDPRTRSYWARQAVAAKIERDPKQAEKRFVYECWREWQKQPDNLGRYKGKAAFARDMLSKCEHLTSQKKIEDWCREWGTS